MAIRNIRASEVLAAIHILAIYNFILSRAPTNSYTD